MRVGQARAVLSTTWVVLALPLIAMVFLQTVHGTYEPWDVGFSWLSPLVIPILSLMIATWSVAETRRDRVTLKNKHVFFLSLLASVFYLALLYVVLLSMPLDNVGQPSPLEKYVETVMRPSSWYLGAIQALVVVIVGKFYLEDIPEEEPGAPPARPDA